MSVSFKKLKKMLEAELEPLLLEKGFSYSPPRSLPSELLIYSRELDDKGFDSIEIRKRRWEPAFRIDLHSHIRGGLHGLDFLSLNKRRNWPIETVEQAQESLREVKELIEKSAWDWFCIDSED